jgi:hypothetical protein
MVLPQDPPDAKVGPLAGKALLRKELKAAETPVSWVPVSRQVGYMVVKQLSAE